MYQWLEQELSAIKTPRFHVIDGPSPALREVIARSEVPLSYKIFVLRFGGAKLYRNSRVGYSVGVFSPPRRADSKDGRDLLHLGFKAGASVYVMLPLGSPEPPVYEFEDGVEEMIADSFHEWLRNSCRSARRRYSKRTWQQILKGPKPFTPDEENVVQARRQFRWTVLGIDQSGDHIVEVMNSAQRKLPVLTIGIRTKDGGLNGAIRLDIQDLEPGERTVMKVDCYKSLAPPDRIELFALPDPMPEERAYYPELRNS